MPWLAVLREHGAHALARRADARDVRRGRHALAADLEHRRERAFARGAAGAERHRAERRLELRELPRAARSLAPSASRREELEAVGARSGIARVRRFGGAAPTAPTRSGCRRSRRTRPPRSRRRGSRTNDRRPEQQAVDHEDEQAERQHVTGSVRISNGRISALMSPAPAPRSAPSDESTLIHGTRTAARTAQRVDEPDDRCACDSFGSVSARRRRRLDRA